MIFNDAKHENEYMDSFGIKEGDEVEVVSDDDLNGKRGIVYQVRLGFGSPLYNVRFHDGWGCIRDNRFSRVHLVLVNEKVSEGDPHESS